MEEDRSDELLLGTKEVDAGLAWLSKNAKKAGEWYKDASADQAGLGDDMLRLLGGGAKNVATVAGAVYEAPVLKQGFQALDALSYYGGKGGGPAAKAAGVDPRIGGAIGNVLGEAVTGLGAKAALKQTARVGKGLKNYGGAFYDLASGTGVGTGAHGASWVSRGPGSPLRAHRATTRTGARSLISGTPQTIVKNFPELTEQATDWATGAYTYARSQVKLGNTKAPLKGYRRFVTPDGKIYRPKPSQRFAEGYTLKFIDKDLVKSYGAARALKEAPWTKQPVINKLQEILEARGEGDKLEKLLDRMVKDYDTKLKSLPKNTTKGHFVSLKEGGLDIAENFGAQPGRSSFAIVDGKRIPIQGNYAEQAASTIRDNVNVPTTWEQYVDLKLPEILGNRGSLKRVRTTGKAIKKTKPTQWSERRASSIKRDLELGINAPRRGELGAPSWKVGDAQVTWYPESMQNPLKGYGQIDILEQTGNKVQKGFKALNKDFENAIKEFPSGTEVILNMVKGDKKREAIYTRLFNQPKWKGLVKRNPDPNLGWIYTAP